MQDENNAAVTPVKEDEDGVSLRDIFKTIALYKWVALIIAAVIAVAGTLVINFGYNRLKQQYVAEFTLVLPGMDNASAVYTYPDGKTFQYADMVSVEALTDVKEAGGNKFADVDVNKVVTKGDISVIRNYNAETNEVSYRLSVDANSMPSEYVATEFLKAVINAPREYVADMTVNYDVYISRSVEADDYERQIELLIYQLNYIQTQYEALVKNYGEFVVANGRTLSSQLNEVNSYVNKNELGLLLTRVKEESILKSADLVDNLRLQEKDYERQLRIAETTLNNLLNGSEGGSVSDGKGNTYLDASVIKEQSDLVGELKQTLTDIQNYISKNNVDTAFETSFIKPQQEILEQFTRGLSKAVVEVYDKSSSVAFLNAGAVKAEGGMGLLTGFILSLVVGIIIALIVAYALGKHKLDKVAAQKPSAAASEVGQDKENK